MVFFLSLRGGHTHTHTHTHTLWICANHHTRRLRDADNQLKDIEFPFDVNNDTAELIARELVEAQLVQAHDADAVIAAIKQLLACLLYTSPSPRD